jgi:2-methylisocitrate lyase-like PEP mutase family enzyme
LGDARARVAQEAMLKSNPTLGERIRLGTPKAVTADREGIPLEIACPQVVNVVIGGKTPSLSQQEFADMGFGIVLYANAALQGAMRGMTNALSHLKEYGELREDLNLVASFEERQKFVQKPFFDELDSRYKK